MFFKFGFTHGYRKSGGELEKLVGLSPNSPLQLSRIKAADQYSKVPNLEV
ncbi:unnamed protein product [Penicillium camemberti]|uniref:Str. FM013 n=1 Tax=Penicillium camemberti (strain FM 013) TaxID=1429867 RepID=A0A0G4P280_PENC3|nr:unnamed protein product [Penicillium camemberti]